MVHVHGRRVQQLVEPLRRISPEQVVTVSVDAGKTTAVALVADFTGERLCRPFSFRLNRSGIAELVARVRAACGTADRHRQLVRVGVEASGYHLPLVAPGVSACSTARPGTAAPSVTLPAGRPPRRCTGHPG